MTYCLECESENENGARYCMKCGKVLSTNENPYINKEPKIVVNSGISTSRCRNCQNDFSLPKKEGEFYCPYCGYPHIKNFV